jgi:hypothetical protein
MKHLTQNQEFQIRRSGAQMAERAVTQVSDGALISNLRDAIDAG